MMGSEFCVSAVMTTVKYRDILSLNISQALILSSAFPTSLVNACNFVRVWLSWKDQEIWFDLNVRQQSWLLNRGEFFSGAVLSVRLQYWESDLRVVKNPLRKCTNAYSLPLMHICFHIFVMGFLRPFMTFKSDSHYWSLTLRTAPEHNCALIA